METDKKKNVPNSELSMIEAAYIILKKREKIIAFSDLIKQVKIFLKKSDNEIQNSLAQFYTDLNTDGGFISLGDNKWGLRSWYAIDSIDEETNHSYDELLTNIEDKKEKNIIKVSENIDYDHKDDFELANEEETVFLDDDKKTDSLHL